MTKSLRTKSQIDYDYMHKRTLDQKYNEVMIDKNVEN